MAGSAPVIGNDVEPWCYNAGATGTSADREVRVASGNAYVNLNASAAAAGFVRWGKYADRAATGLEVDLTAAEANTINELRQAFQIQRMLERDARGGTRFPEILQSHFRVVDPLLSVVQRPVYLGGGTIPVQISSVQQTSATVVGQTPQGNLSGVGTAQNNGVGFTASFTEHSIIVGLISARADVNYQNGINRMFSAKTKFDLYWPALSHLGEQTILNKEIFAQGTVADDAVFGYQERWAEYKYMPSKITSTLRSNVATSLDVWHLAQEFSALPTLSETFIKEDPPMSRVVAVTDEDQFLIDLFFSVRSVRPMPTYSTPGMLDHF
jgi:hypothetical protein